MTLATIPGLDHVVVMVKDLDAAAETWRRLGFTLSPRGTHSAYLGTGNYTIMLDPDYMELLGVIADTDHNAPSRAYLARRGEGLERAAFNTSDPDRSVADLRARGIAAEDPIDFGRPVALPGGGETRAEFRVFRWPEAEKPGGLGIFACHHKTRDAVWLPSLMHHANGARHLAHVEVLSEEPRAAAEHLARLIEGEVLAEADGAQRVPSGEGRAAFLFLDRAMLAARNPGVPLDGLPESGGAGLALAADLAHAKAALGPAGIAGEGRVTVPPAKANGVLLTFLAS